jgi:hypothetical protein
MADAVRPDGADFRDLTIASLRRWVVEVACTM